MADQPTREPCKELNVIHNPDDTLMRLIQFPCTTTEYHNSIPNQPIFTKDVPLNTAHRTWVRLFKPINTPPDTKLPLILYYHGGGFVICSAADTISHDFCTSMASQLFAFVVSVEYRLAPENRLPAAYDDAVDAIYWLRNQALDMHDDNMLRDSVDFSNCYLMGSSAGGNMAYHAGLRALSLDLHPLLIRGIILHQPFFSGLQRTPSELRLANDNNFSLAMSDSMWELALPTQSSRDHEYCNPLVDGSCKQKLGLLGRCFISACGGDLLMDRQLELAKMLEESGVSVVTWFKEEGYHGVNLFELEKGRELFVVVKKFLSST